MTDIKTESTSLTIATDHQTTAEVAPPVDLRGALTWQLLQAVTPRDLADVAKLAEAAAAAKLFGVRDEADAFVRIVTGAELGVTPYTALRTITVIDGRPVLDATLVRALIQMKAEYFRVLETTDTRAVVESKRAGQPPNRTTYTIQEAQRAGLLDKKNWRLFPRAMLLARCTVIHAREFWSDVYAGLYTADELEPPDQTSREQRAASTPLEPTKDPATAQAQPPADPVDAWLAAVEACKSLQELHELGRQVKSQFEQADRARMREAYNRKKAELAVSGNAGDSTEADNAGAPSDSE